MSRDHAASNAPDLPPIILPPTSAAEIPAWRDGLVSWRKQARADLRYDGSAYSRPEFAWVSSCYSCNMLMVWDEAFLDHRTGRYKVEEYLDEGRRLFGGYDAVVLWHAYPRIGFDSRNQFDYYRELPGGLKGLRDVAARFHRKGVRVFLDYNPWDTGTRREHSSVEESLASVIKEIGADGLFLDTMKEGSPKLRSAVDSARRGVAFETEDALPLAGLPNNHLSWAQWFDYDEAPGVLRDRWFEGRHMMQAIRRWDLDHTNELHLAWMNGAGMLVWENIFGSWNGWNDHDRSLLRAMLPIQGHFTKFFSEGAWTPLVSTGVDGVYASEWKLGRSRLWTVVNRRDKAVNGPWVEGFSANGDRLFDLMSGKELSRPEGELGPKGIGALLAVPSSDLTESLLAFFDRKIRSAPEETPPRIHAITATAAAQYIRHAPLPSPLVPAGMTLVERGTYKIETTFRERECGQRGYAPPWGPAHLHEPVVESRQVELGRIAIGSREVSNEEFLDFMRASGYKPTLNENFLAHWSGGKPPAQILAAAAVFVSLADARAYASWKGWRLPTDAEWQVAVQQHPELRKDSKVWNWTDSEYDDGRTRFVTLKGGCSYAAKGSEWYADGGLRPPEFAAKFIEIWEGLDRCETIGFRCVVDLG